MLERDRTKCSKFARIISYAVTNIIGGPNDYLMIQRIFTFYSECDIHPTSKFFEESGYRHDLDFLIISY